MNLAFKCPKCSNIQLKAQRCVDDGTVLVECDLDVENFTEQSSNENQENDFISLIRMVSDLKNLIPVLKPERDYQKCFLHLEVPKKPKILNNLSVCFLYDQNSQRALIHHQIDNTRTGSDVLFITISVFLPVVLVDMGTKISYYYFLLEKKDDKIQILEEINLIHNEKLRFIDTSRNQFSSRHIDGLVLFQKVEESKVKKMKKESMIDYLDEILEILFNNPLYKHNNFLSLMRKVKQSLCCDPEYRQYFCEQLEKFLKNVLKSMDKNRRLSQDLKTIWALTTLFICQDNDLNNILKENQMKILLRTLQNTHVDFFKVIFFDFFTDQQHVICDMFEKHLYSSSQEAIIILFFYYNLLEKRSQSTISKYDFDNCIQDVIKFGSITEDLNERTLNELVKTYKPILEFKKEYAVILIHYLCDSSSKNLQTLLDSNLLSADMLAMYLLFLNKYQANFESKQFSLKTKVIFIRILECLIKIAINHFNYKNLESINSDAELFLLKSLVENQNSNYEIQVELIYLCLIKFHSKAKNSYEHEIELAHINSLIRKWFYYQLGNSRIYDNYELGFNEVKNKNEPFMFDKMLNIPNRSKNGKLVDKNITHLILEILSDRLKESTFDDVAKIYLYYNFDILINNKEIQAEFENNLIEKLSCKNKLISHFSNYLDKQEQIESLMDKFLDKKFPIIHDPCTICLTSGIYRVTLEQMLKENKLLSPKWTVQFEKIFQSFEKVVNELIEGSIEICKLDFLFGHKEDFQVLANMVFDLQPNCAFSKNKVHFDRIINLINIRKNEWHRFNKCINILVFFLQFCSKSRKFSYGSYKTLLEDFSAKNPQLVRINQFCQPIDINHAFSDPLPKITYFEGITIEHFAQMDQIEKLNQLKLVIFNHFFISSFREKCELKTVLEEALPNAVQKWDSFAESIDTEKIKLKELEDYLNIHFDKNVNKCLNELIYIIDYFNKPNKEKSKIQLETYFKFRECYKIAEVFRQVCDEFGIRKNFAQLNELLKFKSDEFENFCLDKMDNRVLSMIRTLDKYSSGKNVECLRAFVECKDLIKWIQKNVKDLKELKFLVDLISLTKSSEIQNSTDKNIFAKAFKEATTAYAPLIFEINADTNFDQFVALCVTVWNNLQNDANMAKKLVEIKDKVGVLEDINKKRGNVELSSIEQARQINENGLFKIELLPKHLAIQDMIQVDVTMVNKVNNTQKEKKFNYEKLNELKSILVLLTKKASDFADDQEDANTLDYFIQIFDNCIRLANIFLNMRNNGCDFFNNLKLNIYSDSNNTRLDNQPLIELMFDRNAAISDAKKPSLQILSEICLKMEHFFDLWTKYVEMVRDEYHFINFFTVNQILLVKSCLQNALDNQQIDHFHFDLLTSMLYNIRSDLEKESFVDVVKRLVEKTKSLKFKNIFIGKKIDKNKVEKFEKIRLYAKNNGFSVRVVKDAYDLYGNFGEKLLNYCLENDSDGYDQNENLEMIETNAGDHEELVEQTFGKKLEQILEKFSQKQNNSSSNNLSMERFAIFLEELYQSGNKSRDFVRDIPGYLIHRGKPNLIVCNQQRDQVEIVLSIYAHSHSAPLPSNDEVLFCNSQTTAEEVENFFRIAFRSDGKKIYTLINIQELTYENSSRVEKFLSSKANLHQSDKYVMVCICSKDRSEHSLIASSFAKNIVKPIVLNSLIINEYVKIKLTTKSQLSLAKYDIDKSNVRALLSKQAGNGKSTYVETFKQSIPNFLSSSNHVIIRIKTSSLDTDKILDKLYKNKTSSHATIYHIDIANEVFDNVDLFIFNLIILNHLKHSGGRVWRRSANDMYFIEMMPQFIRSNTNLSYHATLNFLPRILFQCPRKYFYHVSNCDSAPADNLFESLFFIEKYQRCANYLKLFVESVTDLKTFIYSEENFLDQASCLKILLDYSSLVNPNWVDLNNFVNFMEMQLKALETSPVFTNNPDLKFICTRLIILMSRDFGIPSLNIGDEREVVSLSSNNNIQIELDKLAISRRWENFTHPYVIFNHDRVSFTFMGIFLDRRTYKFINPNTGQFIDDIEVNLDVSARIALLKSQISIYDNFNDFGRTKKIQSLRKVMGLGLVNNANHDPDPTYELTLDNCLKLMAIYMRLKCKIPVIIMGETGCGKTRMIKFLSDLHINPNLISIKHLIHFKVHGGTSFEDIERIIEQAERLSRQNYQQMFDQKQRSSKLASAILFIDEANTTDAIGLIKEIMCDRTCTGRKIDFDHGLRIVAAVNPYRKHSDEMINKLEEAGLGFYVSTSESKEKLGQIPMRQLVYRVQPLPASMLSLVWDFGQLDTDAEKKYIKQMIKREFSEHADQIDELSDLLTKCQQFMRNRNDECSFVSLRDVERVIKVTCWFIDKKELIFSKMNEKNIEMFQDNSYQHQIGDLKRAFLLALTVCYHSSLYNMNTRYNFRKLIAENLNVNLALSFDWVLAEVLKCQHVFLDEIQLANNIARNHALLENVFMIIVCLELRIPLFIVGKPGSSKSLAKSIVESSMHGLNSKSFLFQNLKETYFLNFQCSPLTKAEMIIRTFEEAASFQENNNLEKFVSVINLDEVGLAEASESMPLKTLHPLLEDGADSSENVALPHQKVAVIGISNWALDPAKMNRGIFVSRSEPDISELVESAKGICKYDRHIYSIIEPYITEIATAYLQVCQIAKNFKREFFGLRDYYSLIKMLYWFCLRDGRLTWNKLEHSVKRNFDGLSIDFLGPFKDQLYSKLDKQKLDTDPLCGSIDLIKAALKGENVESNSRYLLLLTENYSVTEIIQNYLINSLAIPAHKIVVIFGSNFKHDMEYTEVCKNISKIKHSMEVGNTVILLNFQNLFESLYDVLNQYYQVFGGQRYVYLGINTQRVNCLVHENFRMIILSNKESVYDSKIFPIPLINRLEKHFLNSATMLNDIQINLCKRLENWIVEFTKLEMGIKLNDIFIGYHEDTLASIILYLIQQNDVDFYISKDSNDIYDTEFYEETLIKAKILLLQCSTLDNLYRAMNKNLLENDYLTQNCDHFSLMQLLKKNLKNTELKKNLFQVTTHSKFLLTRKSLKSIANSLNIPTENISSCLLKSFDTENQFSKKIEQFLCQTNEERKILIVQCDFSTKLESDLLSCARHSINEKFKETIADQSILQNCFIVLLINLSRQFSRKFTGFQVSQWSCHHVDELEDSSDYLLDLNSLKSKSLSKILNQNLHNSASIDQKKFLKTLCHRSCSMIDDTNINRTIERIAIFSTICENDTFLSAILSRIATLQEEKEKNFGNVHLSESWFGKEVVNFRRINECSTLRKSCKSYLESKLSPLLAFLLSKIDIHSNLDTFDQSCDWKSNLFIEIVNSYEFLKINYSEMRDQLNGREQDKFFCKSDIFEKEFFSDQQFSSNIPFFWIIDQQLNAFCQNYLDGISSLMEEGEKFTHFTRTIPSLFEGTVCFKMLKKNLNQQLIGQVFDLYLSDFVLINCRIHNQDQIEVVKMAINNSLRDIDVSDVKISFPLIHLAYTLLRPKIEFFLKFSTLEPKICEHLINKSTFDNLEIESCELTIDEFSREIQSLENLNILNKKLKTLINMVRNFVLFAKKKADLRLYENVSIKINSFQFLDLFHNDVCDRVEAIIATVYSDLLLKLKVMILKNRFDFNKLNTIEMIHDFLLYCVDKARSHCFMESSVSKCCKQICQVYKKINSKDCECLICSDCVNVMKLKMVDQRTVCLGCRTKIQVKLIDDQIGVQLDQVEEKAKPYKNFIQRLNFFYLNVVENLIFSSDPEDKIIQAICEVTIHGRILSKSSKNKFDLDSKTSKLLLQLLFKNYEKSLIYLNEWFNQTDQNNYKNSETAVNFMICVEETLFDDVINKSIDEEINAAERICQFLLSRHHLLYCILKDQTLCYNIESLSYLAKLKFVLKILVKATNNQETLDSIKNISQLNLLISNVKKLIEPTINYTNTVFNFLIKEFVRRYSFSSVKHISNNTIMNWMTPKQIIGDNLGITERYVLTGSKYIQIKRAIQNGFENRNSTELQTILEKDPHKMFPYFLICVFKNVLLLQKNINVQSCDIINVPFEKFYSNKRHYLQEIVDMSQQVSSSIELNLLMLQLKYSIQFSKNVLNLPLADMMESPLKFKESFIPCMPQDTLYDNLIALRQNRTTDNPTLYACPNGHPYILFDCGRPWVITKCSECNENIGGTNHQLCPGNTRLEDQDRTLRGYCLPSANTQNDNPANQRLLNPANFHILRFIIHCILFFAANSKPNELIEIMHTNAFDLKDFFWNYLHKDLRIISKILNLNMDQVFILLHLVSDKILSNQSAPSSSFTKWQSKEERKKYERDFADNFIDCILASYEQTVAQATQELQKEAKNSNDEIQKLYFIAYEIVDDEKHELLTPYQGPDIWKYQPLCDYNVFKTKLALTKQYEHKILKYLIENDHRIKLIKNLNNMMKLINQINDGYYKRLPKHVVKNTSIKHCEAKGIISKSFENESLLISIQAFQDTWFNSKQYLQKYVNQKLKELPTFNQNDEFEFNMETNLSYFLPTKMGDGLLSFVLLNYLIDSQNEFLEFYHKNDQMTTIESNILEFKDYLIDFDPDHDFLRILKSNFIYDQKETQYWFLFENIKNRTVERYIKNKPRIEKNLPVFLCSDEIGESNFYKSLDSVIKQELLDQSIQLTIFQEFKSIEDVTDALNVLKILINYSKTICGCPNDSLSTLIDKIYLEQNIQLVLKMTILEQCQMKHLLSVWLLLIIKKAFYLTLDNINPFENLSDQFKKEQNGELNFSLDSSKNFSFLITIYQIVEYCEKIVDNDLLINIASLKLKDALMYPENLEIFGAKESEKLWEFVNDEEKISSVYEIWKKLIKEMNK